MKICIFIASLMFLFYQCGTDRLMAQKKTNIVITNIKKSKGELIINYDIVNSYPEQLFYITTEMKTADGMFIDPINIFGDVNESLKGDEDYQIIWNIKADKLDYNEGDEVIIYSDVSVDLNYLSFPGLLLRSTLMPGAGLYKLKRKKRAFIYGALGYGSLIASGFFWYKGNSAYNNYKLADTELAREDYYKEVEEFDKFSVYTAMGAASIWLVNYIALTGKWNKLKKQDITVDLNNSKFNFYANYNPVFKKPLLTLTYRF
ncbi:MAG: hypothetical protein B6I20_03630 [Bacteroidetes bacterium 4572_117]|nr:MAG: hypothetical protein B6I20_03630 [Bacteroidetes bacterium 4572_117]